MSLVVPGTAPLGESLAGFSADQQAEIETFRKKQVEVNKQLKQERKNLRREIDSLETRMKWINIAAVPFLVTLTGIGLAFWKRKHTGAR